MTSETETWKLEKDLCRCCHAEGCFQNLGQRCSNSNELLSDMLRTCFDIEISPVTGLLCALTFTICEQCVERLRDASSFKHQVLRCEERFKHMYRNLGKVLNPDIAVKLEEEPSTLHNDVKEEPSAEEDDFDVNFAVDDDDDDEDDDKTVLALQLEAAQKAKRGKAKEKKAPPKAKRKGKSEAPAESNAEEKPKRGNITDDFVLETNDTHKKYACIACKVSYRRLSDLRNHVTRAHLKEKFIKCVFCPETFMYHSQRKAHMHTAHDLPNLDQFQCGECHRHFRRKNTLAEHMMDVHIQKKCVRCDLKFVRKKLLFHMNEAHEVPMPTCGVCGLKTLKESALVRHQRNVHLNEKNKQCNVCGKRFNTKSNLEDHMITHNQKRVLKCEVCGKMFARRECLKSHGRIHSGARPFACVLCSAAFAQRASLRFHMKSHHPGSAKS